MILSSLYWGWYAGIVNIVFVADITYITSIILVLYLISIASIGIATTKEDVIYGTNKYYSFASSMSDHVMAIGMLGTVFGLIHMLSQNIGDTSNMAATMSKMWVGLGLALYTNAAGLIASILLKFQLMLLSADE